MAGRRSRMVRVGVAVLVSLVLVGASVSPSQAAPGDDYANHDDYWEGTGSGGSLRCAKSDIYELRQLTGPPYDDFYGRARTWAHKDLLCVNFNTVPEGFLYAYVEIKEWSSNGYITRNSFGTYSSSAAYGFEVSAPCTTCDHSTYVNTGHNVNSLGSWHGNIMTSPAIAP